MQSLKSILEAITPEEFDMKALLDMNWIQGYSSTCDVSRDMDPFGRLYASGVRVMDFASMGCREGKLSHINKFAKHIKLTCNKTNENDVEAGGNASIIIAKTKTGRADSIEFIIGDRYIILWWDEDDKELVFAYHQEVNHDFIAHTKKNFKREFNVDPKIELYSMPSKWVKLLTAKFKKKFPKLRGQL